MPFHIVWIVRSTRYDRPPGPTTVPSAVTVSGARAIWVMPAGTHSFALAHAPGAPRAASGAMPSAAPRNALAWRAVQRGTSGGVATATTVSARRGAAGAVIPSRPPAPASNTPVVMPKPNSIGSANTPNNFRDPRIWASPCHSRRMHRSPGNFGGGVGESHRTVPTRRAGTKQARRGNARLWVRMSETRFRETR